MATSYLAPGVYVEEVPSASRPIEAVGMSTAAFVGVTPDADVRVNQAVALNNWNEFKDIFAASGTKDYSVLAQAVRGFFYNQGSRCYVVNVGAGQTIMGGGKGRKGLDVLDAIDDVAIVAAPGYTDPASQDAVLNHCERLRRFAILDAPSLGPNDAIRQLTEVAQVGDTKKPAKGDADGAGGGGGGGQGMRARTSSDGHGALYFPDIRVVNALNPSEIITTPPSGYIAGIYARSDAQRGVHKAPANEVIAGALGVVYRVTQQEQEVLNPAGVNCIRYFTGEGIRVWGARTLAMSSSEWRYVNVRRLFNMVEHSIIKATGWMVFEPNDVSLWKRIVVNVRHFLMNLWREGALMGRTEQQAFFVQCDEQTNPPEVIEAGQVRIMIGLAPVKPAEFVIFRITQGVSGAEVEAQTA